VGPDGVVILKHELSDGALRIRVRAFDREKAWAPRYVGDELDATSRRAEQARADAQLWAARAAATDDAATAEQLRADAAAAAAQAVELAERVAQLEDADTARGAWYANTAATRDAAHRARGALAARGVNLDADDERVTAAEWLAAHRAEQAAEDPHRKINYESQLTDPDERHAAADTAAPGVDLAAGRAEPLAETDVPDIRDAAEPDAGEHADPAQRHRVPTAEESAATVARAQTALAEITARRQADAAREAADRDQQRCDELTRWAEHDQATEQTPAHDTHAHAARADEDDLALGR